MLALLSAAIPLRGTATAAAVAVLRDGDGSKTLIPDPSATDIEKAESHHVLAFTSQDDLLVAESEGDFTIADWDRVHAAALEICCQADRQPGVDMVLDDETRDGPDMRRFLRSTMEAKVASDLKWKQSR